MSTYILTLFDTLRSDRAVTKTYRRNVDGTLAKGESTGFSNGHAKHVRIQSVHDLAELIDGLRPHQCLGYGIAEAPDAYIGSSRHLGPNQIPRTNDTFSWPAAGAVLYLDFDGKFTDADIPRLRADLHKAMPALATAGQVWTRSSSNGIIDPITGTAKAGGLHCYVLIDNACAIPRIGKQLYDALWLDGHGRHDMSAADSALEYCLIDRLVWQPSRLDYAAPPVLEDGIQRAGRGTVLRICEGGPLRVAAITPLTDEQVDRVAALKRESRAMLKPEIVKARRTKLASLPADQREQMRHQYLSADRGVIAPSTTLYFQDGHTVAAGDVLANLGHYVGRQCSDPLEPAYGNDPRIARVNRDGTVFSFAHGGRTLRLMPDPVQAPADVVALDPTPSDSDILTACYRHRVYAKADGIAAAVQASGASEEHLLAVWHRHMSSRALPLHMDTPATALDTFQDARNVIDAGKSGLFLAKLGAGKTTELAGHAMKTASRAIVVTVVRSLTRSHAAAFGAVHYTDAREMRDAAPRLATTAHSLREQDTTGLDCLVLDEFASLASLLMSTDSDRIMTCQEQADTLAVLQDMAARGVRIVALDGDASPTATELARLLGLPHYSIAETPHEQPTVQLTARSTTDGTPYHAFVTAALGRGEPVVIATDSKDKAKSLGKLYIAHEPLVIHAENAEEPEQAAFLADPEAGAKRHQLVIYSPAMGVGVSVVKTEAHVIVIQSSGSLDAAAMWQLARRYRRPLGNVIRWSVERHLCSPRRFGLTEAAVATDLRSHAALLGMVDATVSCVIASKRQRAIHEANPLHSVLGHLTNLKVLAGVTVETEGAAVTETKAAKALVKAQQIEAVATADRVTDEEARHLPQTAIAQAKATRHRIERGLALDVEGELDRELVRDYLEGGLLTKVRRHAALTLRRDGSDLEAGADRPAGFAYQPHTNAQADLMLAMVDALRNDDGDIVVTAEAAQALAVTFRSKVRGMHSAIPQPVKDPSRTQASRWLRDLLAAWGFAVVASKKVMGNHVYTYDSAPNVEPHAARVVSSPSALRGARL